MKPRSILALACPFALAVSACEDSGSGSGPRPLAKAAEGTESISARHFSRVTVPCDDPPATARALLELTRRDLGEGTHVQLLDYGTDAIRLRDGDGRIAVIVYSVAGEGEDSAVTTTEHFLINDSCRVMHWSSAVSPAE